MTPDTYGKVTPLTTEIMNERGYYCGSDMGGSQAWRHKERKEWSLARWYLGEPQMTFVWMSEGGAKQVRVNYLHELIALENS